MTSQSFLGIVGKPLKENTRERIHGYLERLQDEGIVTSITSAQIALGHAEARANFEDTFGNEARLYAQATDWQHTKGDNTPHVLRARLRDDLPVIKAWNTMVRLEERYGDQNLSIKVYQAE